MQFVGMHGMLSCRLQWVKTPLLTGCYRGVCEKPSMEMWKLRVSARPPAHLCACALLGRVAQTVAFTPCDKKEADWDSRLPKLQYTGAQTLTE